MIHVERDRSLPDGRVIQPEERWFELARRKTEQLLSAGKDILPEDTTYRDGSVKSALLELFWGKCAYCEKRIEDQEFDVEHFRPKGQVAEDPDHLGYYWLKYEWTNLYPCCKNCNQERYEQVFLSDAGAPIMGGKGTKFPLSDGATRARSHADSIEDEARLLLDPCTDFPENVLLFLPEDGMVRGRDDDPRGKTTIDVFFLKRRRLRRMRERRIREAVTLRKMASQLSAEGQSEAAADLNQFIELHYMADNCDFAGAVRSVLRPLEARDLF